MRSRKKKKEGNTLEYGFFLPTFATKYFPTSAASSEAQGWYQAVILITSLHMQCYQLLSLPLVSSQNSIMSVLKN